MDGLCRWRIRRPVPPYSSFLSAYQEKRQLRPAAGHRRLPAGPAADRGSGRCYPGSGYGMSEEAYREGVRKGMSLRLAMKRCRGPRWCIALAGALPAGPGRLFQGGLFLFAPGGGKRRELRREIDLSYHFLPRCGQLGVRAADDEPHPHQHLDVLMHVLVIALQKHGEGADAGRSGVVKCPEQLKTAGCENLQKGCQIFEVETLSGLFNRFTGFSAAPCFDEILRRFVRPLIPTPIFLSLMIILLEAFGCRSKSRQPKSPHLKNCMDLPCLRNGDDPPCPAHCRNEQARCPGHRHSRAGTSSQKGGGVFSVPAKEPFHVRPRRRK